MNFNEYQKKAITFDVFEENDLKTINVSDSAFMTKLLGLVGESGEVAEKFKKILRDKDGILSDDDKKEVTKELGDVLWYLSVIARYLDVSLDDVAAINIEKLSSRKDRSVLNGKGDNR